MRAYFVAATATYTNKTPENLKSMLLHNFHSTNKVHLPFETIVWRIAGVPVFIFSFFFFIRSVSLRLVTVILKFSFVILIHWQITVNWKEHLHWLLLFDCICVSFFGLHLKLIDLCFTNCSAFILLLLLDKMNDHLRDFVW